MRILGRIVGVRSTEQSVGIKVGEMCIRDRVLAQELCHEAGIDGERPTAALTAEDHHALYEVFSKMVTSIKEETFS